MGVWQQGVCLNLSSDGRWGGLRVYPRYIPPPNPERPPSQPTRASSSDVAAFVVLGSIVIHGLSIPFFTLGGNMQMRTRSLFASFTLTRGDPSDWLLSLRRGPPVVPVRPAGQQASGDVVELDIEAGGDGEGEGEGGRRGAGHSATATIVEEPVTEDSNVNDSLGRNSLSQTTGKPQSPVPSRTNSKSEIRFRGSGAVSLSGPILPTAHAGSAVADTDARPDIGAGVQ